MDYKHRRLYLTITVKHKALYDKPFIN